MESEHGTIGGFTAVNTGTITDCYCMYVTAPKKIARCFAGKNSGNIKNSFSTDKGQIGDLWNSAGEALSQTIHDENEAEKIGFSIGDIWEYTGGNNVLRFVDKNWYKELSAEKQQKNTILLKSADDLERFCAQVNKGDERVMKAHLKLTCDIDGKGKKLPPIGKTRQNAFAGVFDGGGHTIRNYRIGSDGVGNVGFFGYLLGTVLNLSLDIAIKGEGNLGALCGTNEGKIICCGAVARLSGSGDKLKLGGLTGQNLGEIERSYAAFQIVLAPVPLLPIAIIASMVMLLGVVGFSTIPAIEAAEQPYAPIPSDENQIRIPEEKEPENPKNSGRGNSISFKLDETLHIDPETGNVYINFENPSYAKNKIVVTLLAEDDRSEMAKTGAITPGHGIKTLRLNDNGYEKINSGVRSGIITLTAYDTENNDKAMVDTELPVHIAIE